MKIGIVLFFHDVVVNLPFALIVHKSTVQVKFLATSNFIFVSIRNFILVINNTTPVHTELQLDDDYPNQATI
jgi:hypothetical protein